MGAPSCGGGEFCLWSGVRHSGARFTWDLSTTGVGTCVPLPPGWEGRSFVNRLARPVTVYQDRECGTEGEFDTYPGHGTWVPESPFTVRAFKVWER